MSGRAVPFHCPFCGDEDLRPHGDAHGQWECHSCQRAFKLNFIGILNPAGPASSNLAGTTPSGRRTAP